MNYLALIGWSPRTDRGAAACAELARRFRLEDVSHSAGVFDEAKLSWVNRHYLKALEPARLIEEARPSCARRQSSSATRGPPGMAGAALPPRRRSIASAIPRPAPQRLSSMPTRPRNSAPGGRAAENARAVVLALAADLASAPDLVDRETFRAAAARVKDRTGQKGRGLFHPIRLALTGMREGPELDVLVPAIDRAASLPSPSGLAPVVSCRVRAKDLAARLAQA